MLSRLNVIGFGAIFLCLLIAPLALAGSGALTPELVDTLRESFQMDIHTRSMYNALTNTDINNLALNRDILQEHNEVFSNKIKARGITNQKSSGRCWLFAGLNILRPAVMEKYKLNSFEFSQNYLAFWDKMEKANTFLEYIIAFRDRDPLDRELMRVLQDPFGDGGYWQYVVDLIDKYGVVPKDVMPETNSSSSTGSMNNLVCRKLRADAAHLRRLHAEGKSEAELRAAKNDMLAGVYRMLVVNLGEPPQNFPYRFENRDSVVSEMKTYTPQSFYKEFVGIDLKEYVDIYNDPSRDFGNHYTISMTRNMFDRDDIKYANADISILKEVAMKSLLDSEPVFFSCDVGKDQSRDKGIMALGLYDYDAIYDIDMSMTKAERSLYRESAANHAMVFVGVDVKENKPAKWMVENSWGSDKGSGGYWTLYDSWFTEHVYDVVVKKKYVPKEILDIYEKPLIVLPPWDPMWDIVR